MDNRTVTVSAKGFRPRKLTIYEGEAVIFVAELRQKDSRPFQEDVYQVLVAEGNVLPVEGGFAGNPFTSANGQWRREFSLPGTYYFSCGSAGPLCIKVQPKPVMQIKVTDNGVGAGLIQVYRGDRISWAWHGCSKAISVTEMTYCLDHGGFKDAENKIETTRSGHWGKQFLSAGLFYFKCGEEVKKETLSVVQVIERAREHYLLVNDNGFSRSKMEIDANDRVWYRWQWNQVSPKYVNLYRVDAPGDGKQGRKLLWQFLVDYSLGMFTYVFSEPGIYQTETETDDVSCCIIVRPQPKQHVLRIGKEGFIPALGLVKEEDRIWWTWNKDVVDEDFVIIKSKTDLDFEADEDDVRESALECCQKIDSSITHILRALGVFSAKLDFPGLHAFKMSRRDNDHRLCCVIAERTSKVKEVVVTDSEFRPQVTVIGVSDFVVWKWTAAFRKSIQMTDLFDDNKELDIGAEPMLGSGAFKAQFNRPGIYRFSSKGFGDLSYGLVIVEDTPKVHRIQVTPRGVKPDPIIAREGDVVCWMWPKDTFSAISYYEDDSISDSSELQLTTRRCYSKVFKEAGLYNFTCFSLSSQQQQEDGDWFPDMIFSSVICDPLNSIGGWTFPADPAYIDILFVDKGTGVFFKYTEKFMQDCKWLILDAESEQLVNKPDYQDKTLSLGKIYVFYREGAYLLKLAGGPSEERICRVQVTLPDLKCPLPFISSELDGGNVEEGYQLMLDKPDVDSTIYFTTDGSKPLPGSPWTQKYSDDLVTFGDKGLQFIRSAAYKPLHQPSEVFTSRRFWVMAKETESRASKTPEIPRKEPEQRAVWAWQSYHPRISVTYVSDGTINVEWNAVEDLSVTLVEGFMIYVDGLPRGQLFGPLSQAISVSGLRGGRTYQMALVVFPKDAENMEPKMSNELSVTCPSVSRDGGPMVSLESLEHVNQVIVLWMATFHPEKTASNYSLYVNGVSVNDKISPTDFEDYCSVLIEGLNQKDEYRVRVIAEIEGEVETSSSNEVTFTLPLPNVSKPQTPLLPSEDRLQSASVNSETGERDFGSRTEETHEEREVLFISEGIRGVRDDETSEDSYSAQVSFLDNIPEQDWSTSEVYGEEDLDTLVDDVVAHVLLQSVTLLQYEAAARIIARQTLCTALVQLLQDIRYSDLTKIRFVVGKGELRDSLFAVSGLLVTKAVKGAVEQLQAEYLDVPKSHQDKVVTEEVSTIVDDIIGSAYEDVKCDDVLTKREDNDDNVLREKARELVQFIITLSVDEFMHEVIAKFVKDILHSAVKTLTSEGKEEVETTVRGLVESFVDEVINYHCFDYESDSFSESEYSYESCFSSEGEKMLSPQEEQRDETVMVKTTDNAWFLSKWYSAHRLPPDKSRKDGSRLFIKISSVKGNKVSLSWRLDKKVHVKTGAMKYTVLILGVKFSKDVNSNAKYDIDSTPFPDFWPKQSHLQRQCTQHKWETRKTALDIRGLKPRYSYSIHVHGVHHRDASKRCLGVLLYTMPGPPSKPVLTVKELGDTEVCLQWEPSISYGDAVVYGYNVYVNGVPYGSMLPKETSEMTFHLAPGTLCRFSMRAVTQSKEIGPSKVSKEVVVVCPEEPLPVANLCGADCDEIGSLKVSWNQPYDTESLQSARQSCLKVIEEASTRAYAVTPEVCPSRPSSVLGQLKNLCYFIFVDGKFYDKVKPDGFKPEVEYTIKNCQIGREYHVEVKSFVESEVLETQNDCFHICGCSSKYNSILNLPPFGPPMPLPVKIREISSKGVHLAWEKARDSPSAQLSGYLILVNGAVMGEKLEPGITSYTLCTLPTARDYEVAIVALTENPIATKQAFENERADIDTGYIGLEERAEPLSTLRQALDKSVNSSSYLARYGNCLVSHKKLVHFTGFVRKPVNFSIVEVLGLSAKLKWGTDKHDEDHFVEPEFFVVTCMRKDENHKSPFVLQAKDCKAEVTGLKPGTAYEVQVESRARHPNDMDAHDSKEQLLSREASEWINFETGRPPVPACGLEIKNATRQSLVLQWKPPVERGVPVTNLLLAMSSFVKDERSSTQGTKSSGSRPSSNQKVLWQLFEIPKNETQYRLPNLSEKREFEATLYTVTPHSNRQLLKTIPREESLNDQWTPAYSALIPTAGCKPAHGLYVINRGLDSFDIFWEKAEVFGVYNLLHYRVIVTEITEASQNAKLGQILVDGCRETQSFPVAARETSAHVDKLRPGLKYEVTVEACLGIGDVDKSNADEGVLDITKESSEDVVDKSPSESITTWTRCPPSPPKLNLTSFSESGFEFNWNKPCLINTASISRDKAKVVGNVHRVLLGYYMEINHKEFVVMSPSDTTFTYMTPIKDRQHEFSLTAVTCSEDMMKERRRQWQMLLAASHSDKVAFAVNFPLKEEDTDESTSEPVVAWIKSYPHDDSVNFTSVSCTFAKNRPGSSSDAHKSSGTLLIKWNVEGHLFFLNHFRVCYSIESQNGYYADETDYKTRSFHISNPKPKEIYFIKLEGILEREEGKVESPILAYQIPGCPDPPTIACRTVSRVGFTLEWNEPQCYGNTKIGGYQLYINGLRMGKTLQSSAKSCIIPCRSGRTYKVFMTSFSSDVPAQESRRSNEVSIHPTQEQLKRMSSKQSLNQAIVDPLIVRVGMVSEDSIALQWTGATKGSGVEYYVIQWTSVAAPRAESKKLPASQQQVTLTKCKPGTSYFILVAALNQHGHTVAKAQQLCVQTNAPLQTPNLRARTCTATRILLEWQRSKEYGEVRLQHYLLKLDGIDYAEIPPEDTLYQYTFCEAGGEYSFVIKAISTKPGFDSEESDPLLLVCPGVTAPILRRLDADSPKTIKVGWTKPELKGGAKVRQYYVHYVPSQQNQILTSPPEILNRPGLISHGPLPPYSFEDTLNDASPSIMYSVVVACDSSPEDIGMVYSEVIRTRTSLPVSPSVLDVTVHKVDERGEFDDALYYYITLRDRLVSDINALRSVISIKQKAERENRVAKMALAVAQVDVRINKLLEKVAKLTGTAKITLKWCFPGNVEGNDVRYQVLLDGKLYGKPIPAKLTETEIEIPCDRPSHQATLMSLTSQGVGNSAVTKHVDISTVEFNPFTYFCLFSCHLKGSRWPDRGCCSFMSSWRMEHSLKNDVNNRVAYHQGYVKNFTAPPAVRGIDLLSGQWKPIYRPHQERPTLILFWTYWCVPSLRVLKFLDRFSKDFPDEFQYSACCTNSNEPAKVHRQQLLKLLQGDLGVEAVRKASSSKSPRVKRKDMLEHTSHVMNHFCACHLEVEAQIVKRKISIDRRSLMSPTDMYGIPGVPYIVIIHPKGNIFWQGRLGAPNHLAFSMFLHHTLSTLKEEKCEIPGCSICDVEALDIETLFPDTRSEKVTSGTKSGKERKSRSQLREHLFPDIREHDRRYSNHLTRSQGTSHSADAHRGDLTQNNSDHPSFPSYKTFPVISPKAPKGKKRPERLTRYRTMAAQMPTSAAKQEVK